jgi:hypothetical protein
MQPANHQEEESKMLEDDSYIETDRGDYLSEKKEVPVIPTIRNKEKLNRNLVPFSTRNSSRDPVEVAKILLQEFSKMGLQINYLWSKVQECIKIEPKNILELLKYDHTLKM